MKKDEIELLDDAARVALEDYFAAAALTGLIACPQDLYSGGPTGAARMAYEIADAMLKQREWRRKR